MAKDDSASKSERAAVAYVKLIPLKACRAGGGTFVEHNDREFAVFRLTDPKRIVVTDNACPHASGNLSGGDVDGLIVTCPWHHWEFDLISGRCTHSDKATIHKYRAEIRDGFVWVDL